MSDAKKRAYRYLLSLVMLDIRMFCRWQGEESQDPQEILEQYRSSRRVGALAQWLHNLPQDSESDFRGFNEEVFWKEYDLYRQQFPSEGIGYKEAFEDELERYKAHNAQD